MTQQHSNMAYLYAALSFLSSLVILTEFSQALMAPSQLLGDFAIEAEVKKRKKKALDGGWLWTWHDLKKD